jgi:hypothetical protein
LLSFVIPAKAGIQFLLWFLPLFIQEQELPLSCGQRVTFLTPGILPSAPSGPATLFAPLLRRSAGAKKVTKETPFKIRAAPGLTQASSESLRRSLLRVRRGGPKAAHGVLAHDTGSHAFVSTELLDDSASSGPDPLDWGGSDHCSLAGHITWGADHVLSFLVTFFFARAARAKKEVTRSSAGGVEALA